MFDGMNLVAKEGPLLNENAGVSILSENTGAHDELGEFALSVNPFDIQELADSIHAALEMDPAERARRLAGLQAIVTARNPGEWLDEQLDDIAQEGRRRRPAAGLIAAPRPRARRRWYHRPPLMADPANDLRPDPAARPRAPRTTSRAKIVADARAAIAGRGHAASASSRGACARSPTRSTTAPRPSTTCSSSAGRRR